MPVKVATLILDWIDKPSYDWPPSELYSHHSRTRQLHRLQSSFACSPTLCSPSFRKTHLLYLQQNNFWNTNPHWYLHPYSTTRIIIPPSILFFHPTPACHPHFSPSSLFILRHYYSLFCQTALLLFQKLQNRLRNLQLKWSSQEHYLHFAWENNMKSNSFLFSTFSRQHVLLMRIPYIFVFSLLYTLMLLTLRCQWWTSEGRTQTFTLFSVLPSSCQILNPTTNQRWIWLDRPRFHHHSCQNSVKEMFLSNEDFRKWSVMPSLKSIF